MDYDISISTNFEQKTVDLEVQFDNEEKVHILMFNPEKALFVSQMLIEKSLNILQER